ncbi:MAG: 16S rRNA (adenine(1518)-N(6)/adenine(1519)-N(6))-dimethyltransferase RsmA [Rhodospirillales bacterium]|nr:16S rRNA (adenine(1518)-N(6)/adenine(1519)-N(6))-dimethyltransferase RsmA [Rhodospirillales bacterium]
MTEPTAPGRPEDLPPLRDVIARLSLRAKKSFGQNFLLDLNLTQRIAGAAGSLKGVNVIEIGPGPGGLTRALMMQGAERIYAVERDFRCIDAINEISRAYENRVQIIEADALDINLADICPAPRIIVANLPYNVATPLLIKWLKNIAEIDGMTLMFQKEVADRLTALPRTKAYGRLSVMSQWLCHVRQEFNVAKEAFTPPPKVTSTVVTLMPRKQPLAPATWSALEKVTAAAFNQRRKMLRASLKSFNFDFDALAIKETARAEELSIEDFCRLARELPG